MTAIPPDRDSAACRDGFHLDCPGCAGCSCHPRFAPDPTDEPPPISRSAGATYRGGMWR